MNQKELYAEYLQSEHWSKFKESKALDIPKRCLACLSRSDIQLHHMIYRHPLESVELEDTCWLCRGCHEIFHARVGMQLDKVPYRLLAAVTVRTILTQPAGALSSYGLKELQKIQRMAPRKDDEWDPIAPKKAKLPKYQAAEFSGQKITYADQEKMKTKKGGFSRNQMAAWGVKWPAKKGWRQKLNRGLNPNE